MADQNDQNQESDALQQKVTEAQQQAAEQSAQDQAGNELGELKEALARSMADMQNLKRRSEEDRVKLVRFANADLLKKLLPTIDNFDRACQQIPAGLKEDSWVKGVVSTHDELMKMLSSIGAQKMQTVGQRLDLNKHEAVMQDAGEKDMILEEFEPGYELNGTVLKPARVKVGNGS